MLDARYVADHLDEVRKALARRSPEAAQGLDSIAELSAERRSLIVEVEQKQAERNAANQDMAELAKTDSAAFEQRREELKTIGARIAELDAARARTESRIEELLLAVPNLPHASTPPGSGSDDNPVVRTWGEKPSFRFEPKSHWDVGERLRVLDFERASKLSGARFSVLFGLGARLSRALGAFMLDLQTREHGYTEVVPPYLVRASALLGTGQLPKFEADLFKTGRNTPDDPTALYLIPTAEVPLTNLHADEIIEQPLPLAYTAFTPCFR